MNRAYTQFLDRLDDFKSDRRKTRECMGKFDRERIMDSRLIKKEVMGTSDAVNDLKYRLLQ